MNKQNSSKYWVSMTDKFLSGWGCADNKTDKLVIECNTYEEALIVAENAENRSEMKNVNICMNKPRYSSSRYTVSYKDKTQCGRFFEKGGFKKANRFSGGV